MQNKKIAVGKEYAFMEYKGGSVYRGRVVAKNVFRMERKDGTRFLRLDDHGEEQTIRDYDGTRKPFHMTVYTRFVLQEWDTYQAEQRALIQRAQERAAERRRAREVEEARKANITKRIKNILDDAQIYETSLGITIDLDAWEKLLGAPEILTVDKVECPECEQTRSGADFIDDDYICRYCRDA